jgi:hypothetical protein
LGSKYVTKRVFVAKPLASRVALFFLRTLVSAGWVVLSLIGAGCGQDSNQSATGSGISGDVGEKCLVLCYADWCKDDDQVDCSSSYCLGQPDKTYCTVMCDLDSQCPDGYLCTDDCETEVAKQPVCVKTKDYSYLQELGYCPAD